MCRKVEVKLHRRCENLKSSASSKHRHENERVVIFMFQLYIALRVIASGSHWIGGIVGPKDRGEEKYSFP
jgi:hypothetical protein